MFKKHDGTDKAKFYMNMCFFHYALINSQFYHIIFMYDHD